MTAPAALRPGQVVRYHGSHAAAHGLYRVSHRYECTCKELGFASCDLCDAGHAALYDLAPYFPGEQFTGAPGDVALFAARPASVTHVPAREARKAAAA